MRKTEYILLLFFSLPAVFFLLKPGFYEPHDLHHIADIYEMFRAFASGQFPPRLGPDFSFGYGYPLFNFYYVLPFYFGSLFYSLLGSLQLSFKLVFVISIFLSVFGMYLFLREFFNKWASFTGTVLFLYSPYRAVQIYVRGAMGEALALSLAPYVLWLLIRLIKEPFSKKLIAVSSLVTALLILSHNFFWVIVLPFILILVLILIQREKFIKSIISVGITLILAIGITSYWWLPALLEQNLLVSTTPFPLIDHFPFIKQLIIPSWGYGSSVWGPGDGLSFQVGIINWIVFLIMAVLTLLMKIKKVLIRKIAFWALAGFLISVFLMNIRSYPLWKIIPFYDFVQFPWRLLFLTTLFTSVMAAVIVDVVGKKEKFISVFIILGSLILTFGYFRPSKVIFKSDNDYLSRLFANRTVEGEKSEVSSGYLTYSEDYLLLPKGVRKRPDKLPAAKIEGREVQVSDINELNAVKWSAKLTSETGGVVKFNSIYFPGWIAEVDGKITPIAIGNPNGQVEINVGKGVHEAVFFWKETVSRKMADLLSITSMVIILVLFIYGKKQNPKIAS